jgi:hypothetical protein
MYRPSRLLEMKKGWQSLTLPLSFEGKASNFQAFLNIHDRNEFHLVSLILYWSQQ